MAAKIQGTYVTCALRNAVGTFSYRNHVAPAWEIIEYSEEEWINDVFFVVSSGGIVVEAKGDEMTRFINHVIWFPNI